MKNTLLNKTILMYYVRVKLPGTKNIIGNEHKNIKTSSILAEPINHSVLQKLRAFRRFYVYRVVDDLHICNKILQLIEKKS